MILIVGLGNPGRRYLNNRHNIGFMAADAIFRRHRFSPWRARFQGEVAEGMIDGNKVLILKPATFMNKSGHSVGEAVRFYKIDPSDVTVIYDELDLPPGKLRVKLGGSASHNGLKSITSQIGPHFRRLRMGIGHPGHRDLVNAHVLRDFAKADKVWLDPMIDAVADYIPLLVENDESGFMNKIHLAMADVKTGDDDDEKPLQAKKSAKTNNATSAPKGPTGSKPGPGRTRQTGGGQVGGALAEGLKRLFGRSKEDGRS